MKAVAVLVASGFVWGAAALGFVPTARGNSSIAVHRFSSTVSLLLPQVGVRGTHRVLVPFQAVVTPTAGTTVSPTDTPVPTVTPTPTATGPAYPDAQALLTQAFTLLNQQKTDHFHYLLDAEQKGVEKLHVDWNGNATCKGAAYLAHVVGSHTLETTGQTQKLNYYLIQVGAKYFTKASKKNSGWKSSKANKALPFGFDTDLPLPCFDTSTGTGSGSGTSTTSTQFRDTVNLGPEVYHGVAVWHVHETQVTIDTQANTTTEAPIDFYITRDQSYLYGFQVAISLPKDGVTLTTVEFRDKFGAKVTVTKPKIGSKKP